MLVELSATDIKNIHIALVGWLFTHQDFVETGNYADDHELMEALKYAQGAVEYHQTLEDLIQRFIALKQQVGEPDED